MDILQTLGSLLGQGMGGGMGAQHAQPRQSSALGGLAGMLTPEILGGIAGALFPANKTGGRRLGAASQGGGDSGLGGLLGSVLGGGAAGSPAGGMGGLGVLGGLLSSFMSGGAGESMFGGHVQDAMQSDGFSRQYANQAPAPGPQDRAERMLRAVVYAAKADGHIDARERAGIDAQLKQLNIGAEGRAFINQVIQEQIDPGMIAAGIADPNEAIQIYALSCALTGMDNAMEVNYLNSLAGALGIPNNVKTAIEARTGQ